MDHLFARLHGFAQRCSGGITERRWYARGGMSRRPRAAVRFGVEAARQTDTGWQLHVVQNDDVVAGQRARPTLAARQAESPLRITTNSSTKVKPRRWSRLARYDAGVRQASYFAGSRMA